MSDRTTGAKDWQIERARNRWENAELWPQRYPAEAERTLNTVARHLVDPDERIVKAADLRAVLALVEFSLVEISDRELEAAAARLREVLGDA